VVGEPGSQDVDLLDRLAADVRHLRGLLDEVASEPNPRFAQSLVRGLYVLASLPGDGHGVGIAKLAAHLEMPAGTVYRYLHTLIVAGLAQHDEKTHKYRLAFSLVASPAAGAQVE